MCNVFAIVCQKDCASINPIRIGEKRKSDKEYNNNNNNNERSMVADECVNRELCFKVLLWGHNHCVLTVAE